MERREINQSLSDMSFLSLKEREVFRRGLAWTNEASQVDHCYRVVSSILIGDFIENSTLNKPTRVEMS